MSTENNNIDHPRHYTSHPSGVECIDIAEHFGFNLGNATKYIWRAGLKSADPLEDLKKARWYIEREIGRLQRAAEAEIPRGTLTIVNPARGRAQ
jgi:hypothetical protein